MKAVVYHNYGMPKNLELREVEMPVVTDDEVLVRIHAASVNWIDWHFLTGKPLMARLLSGLRRPRHKILGIDFAGQVQATGANVTDFRAGDDVFGTTSHGCFAEYVTVSPMEIVTRPPRLNCQEAAAVPAAAATALHALRDAGRVGPGQEVLVNGASGGVGTFGVQIAKALGATVTGVCSTPNVAMVGALGAVRVIDYARQDFAHEGHTYDVILDAPAKRSFTECKPALKPKGAYITTEFTPLLAIEALWKSTIAGKKMVPLPPRPPSSEDLAFLKELLESGAVMPVVDRTFTLECLADALRQLAEGHTRGKIIVTV